MPSFTPPTAFDEPQVLGVPHPGNKLLRHYRALERGRSVLKIAGTWTTVDSPTTDQVNDATQIRDAAGNLVPGAFTGGRTFQITEAIKTELVAAGYTVVG